jgi:tetratricopeptide (TPR) repeat protein
VLAIKNQKASIITSFILVFTICIGYLSALDYGFSGYDDNQYITDNDIVKKGLTVQGFLWAFTEYHASNWHPVTWLSHMLDVELFGQDPSGHHLTSLLFHIANALILFFLLQKLTGSLWRSAFVAILFGLHPLNVESVVWISERKNVLSTFFFLVTLYTYSQYAQNPRLRNYLWVFLFLNLGLMAKPMLVTLPFVLLLMDFWPLQRKESIKTLILEKIPHLISSMIVSTFTFFAQKESGAMEFMYQDSLTLYSRIANALNSYWHYLTHIFLPKDLAVFYPHPGNVTASWNIVTLAIGLIIATYLTMKYIKQAPYLLFGWLFYLGTLFPVIGIIQVGSQAMADRYMYIPMIGILIASVWSIGDLLGGREKMVLPVLIYLCGSLLIMPTRNQISYWENDFKLFDHAIQVSTIKPPNLVIAYNHAVAALIDQGKLTEALEYAEAGVRVNSSHITLLQRIALLYDLKNDLKHAESYYRRLVYLKFNDSKNQLLLANFLLYKMNRAKEAIPFYHNALTLEPDNIMAETSLRIAYDRS